MTDKPKCGGTKRVDCPDYDPEEGYTECTKFFNTDACPPQIDADCTIPCPGCEDCQSTCDDTGICEPPPGASGIVECIHCGKELRWYTGEWRTWDAKEGGE